MAESSREKYEETSVSMQNVDVALFPRSTGFQPQVLRLNVPIVHEKRLLSFTTDNLARMQQLLARIRDSRAKADGIRKELQEELEEYNQLINKGTPEAILNADSPSLVGNTNGN